jgi:hypothetical protein
MRINPGGPRGRPAQPSVNIRRTTFDFSKAALQVIYVFEAPGHALAETAADAVQAAPSPERPSDAPRAACWGLRPVRAGLYKNTASVARMWCSTCLLALSRVWVYVVFTTVTVPEV